MFGLVVKMESAFEVTEPPLSAGSMASLHLGSFALEYRLTLEDFHAVQKGFPKLKATKRNRGLKSLRKAANAYSLQSHEQDHMNRLVGTSFGYMLDIVRSRWVMATAELVGEKLESTKSVLPLGNIEPSKLDLTGDILGDLERRSGQLRQHLVCQGLSDCLHALMDDASGQRTVSALWGLTKGNSEKVLYLLDNAERPFRSGYSLLTPEGARQPLTSRHLLELFGWREQGNALIGLGYDVAEVESLFLTDSHEYQLAFEVWRTVIPQANDLITAAGGAEKIWWGKSFPFELFVCADLALWPPFEPPGRIQPGFRWYDINPAKRFVSILVAFRELGLSLSTSRSEDSNGKMLDLQSKLCRRLHWPTPDSLARAWLEYLSDEKARNATPWHELEPEISLRVNSAVAILRARVEHPSDVVLNRMTLEEFGGRSAPIWIFQMPDGAKHFAKPAEPFEEFVHQLLLYEGTAHLYVPNRPIIDGLEERWMCESTARYTAMRFAEYCEWAEDKANRFAEICSAYFVK